MKDVLNIAHINSKGLSASYHVARVTYIASPLSNICCDNRSSVGDGVTDLKLPL